MSKTDKDEVNVDLNKLETAQGYPIVAPEDHEVFVRREDGPNFRGVSWCVTLCL
jgi:hypothetical protein